LASALHAQWKIQHSGTTSDLRGIHHVDRDVAWASGTRGTVLRTTDGGDTWRSCAVPPGAQRLDFRAVQAFDDRTAMVMSSGPGDLSRVYKTSDGCLSWKLVFINPDAEGFWDALQFSGPQFGVIVGDPVGGRFPIYATFDGGTAWQRLVPDDVPALQKRQSVFAASNSSLLLDPTRRALYFITGGGSTAVMEVRLRSFTKQACRDCVHISHTQPDLASGDTAGGFAIGARQNGPDLIVIAVGGDYKQPEQRAGTAASGRRPHRGRLQWYKCQENPRGYRSAVAYDTDSGAWIAVGPNGTDISRDDGRTWHPLRSNQPEADNEVSNWNALSLPYVVGPEGRIGKLRANLLSGVN
jgi:hypothetical protein